MPISIQQFARKVGFGAAPGGQADAVDDWIDAQLAMSRDWRAYPTIYGASEPSLTAWPEGLGLSLDDRIARLRRRRKAKDDIDARKLPDPERMVLQERNWAANSIERLDQTLFLQTAVLGDDQLRLRLAHFWLNHFTVGNKETTGELIGDYWVSLYDQLDGSFADLLYRATTHPAMLTYLDNIYNIGTSSPKARGCTQADCIIGINDNLGRELLELHTVSPKRGYTEQDIHEAARVLAGWGNVFDLPFHTKPKDWSQPWEPFHAEPGAKSVLGWTIAEGKSGLRQLTDHLAEDPATILHLSAKLARHFLGGEPDPAEIGQIAAVWRDTSGHLPAIHRTVLRLAARTTRRRFQWPLTWAVTVMRLSGGHLVMGTEDIGRSPQDDVERDAGRLMDELGNSFWSERQPNGFSEDKADWLSTEHMDRRMRFADLVARHAKGVRPVDAILADQDFAPRTIDLCARGRTETQRFILLMCSPEMMET